MTDFILCSAPLFVAVDPIVTFSMYINLNERCGKSRYKRGVYYE